MNNENPFAAAWDRHKAATPDVPGGLSQDDVDAFTEAWDKNVAATPASPDEEVFDFDGAQDFDQMMAELRPGHNRHTMRNYAKDRTLAGKKRRKAAKRS